MSRKIRKTFIACIALAVLVLPAGAAASPESRMLKAIDGVRHSHGLPALRDSGTLSHSAEHWSQSMLSRGYFGHGARISAPGNWAKLGENLSLSFGWRTRVGPVIRTWMNSPGHRSVLLSPAYRYAGVGAARGRFRGKKATAWTLHVGRPAKGRRKLRRL